MRDVRLTKGVGTMIGLDSAFENRLTAAMSTLSRSILMPRSSRHPNRRVLTRGARSTTGCCPVAPISRYVSSASMVCPVT